MRFLSILPFLGLSCFLPSCNKGGDAPELLFHHPIYDFGEIGLKEKGSHTFNFENVGCKPLVVNKVVSSCGCTTARFTTDTVSPGEQGEIEVLFYPGETGRFQKILLVCSNARRHPKYVLKIRGTVIE
ncbi:MAG: DUF1573 domain-containing protein [Bacteroidales bacterium]|nr:DUF1573 domain-containing protein [Bacteroidales bacterium]